MTAISAKEMQQRVASIATQSWMKDRVNRIVLSDQKALKEEKVNEFTRGERPDGRKIGKYSSANAEYAIFKNQINPLAGIGNVDLLLTRSFTGKMFVEVTGKGYEFDSTDSKTANLLIKYGNEIMGLNQEWFNQRNATVYRDILLFDISKVLNKK